MVVCKFRVGGVELGCGAMTCSYAFYFVAFALSIIISVLAAITLIVCAIFIDVDTWIRVAIGSFSIPLIAYAKFMQHHSRRVQLRSGVFPKCCTAKDDFTPRSKGKLKEDLFEEIQEFCAQKMLEFGRPATVVGSGWGFFLKRAGPNGPRLFLSEMAGQIETIELDDSVWFAGTTIAAVNQHLLKNDKTLASSPTMQYITIGSWFAQANHGNNSSWHAGSEAMFKSAEVIDMRTGKIRTITGYCMLRQMFDDTTAAKYAVLTVQFDAENAFVKNSEVQKRGIILDSPTAAAAYLTPGAKLMLVFVGSSRRHAVGLRWSNVYDKERTHRDPHACSVACQFLQADLCSVCCGYLESMRRWNGTSTLSHANTWVPHITALEEMTVIMLGYINFEIVANLPQTLNGNSLFNLTSHLSSMHYIHGGRSEIRVSNKNINMIYIDISLRKSSFEAPFKMLFNMGIADVALHPGKFTQLSTSPCSRRSMFEILTKNWDDCFRQATPFDV